ncbi:MAG: N-formylglutamate amidohydrolase [Candidatus Omnitrophota bacterium]
MYDSTLWRLTEGDGPILAAANHDGHELRPEVAERLALSEEDRLLEEDPFTGLWTKAGDIQIVMRRSRFEMDVNRPHAKAVYLHPEDAWGLRVWKEPPSSELLARSLAQYDAYYAEMRRLLSRLEKRYGRFIVLDLHSYNHRRLGPDSPPADSAQNPEVILGTLTMRRERWTPLVERFLRELREADFLGRKLDARENVKFGGGYFPQWVHENFPQSGCALAIEFKKFFMDEWTGAADHVQLDAITRIIQKAADALREEWGKRE